MIILVLDNQVKSLCDKLRLNKQETHLAYTEFKAIGVRRIPDQINKLLVAIDTLSPATTNCERGFRAMNNILTYKKNVIMESRALNFK